LKNRYGNGLYGGGEQPFGYGEAERAASRSFDDALNASYNKRDNKLNENIVN
jgi:hypothetical protein